jgi:CO/xanthine dehydrogenase Mo-binding subunit
MSSLRVVGKPKKRVDALEKVLGKAVYAGDIDRENMLVGKIFRSKYPHALIKSIDKSKALAIPGVRAVLTAADIKKGTNRYGLAVQDQEVLVEKKVRYIGDPVAAVAADTEEIAEEALNKIEVEYEVLPVIDNIEKALAPGAPHVHEQGNLLQHTKLRKGNIEKGRAESYVTVKDRYTTQWVEHAYLEPETTLAEVDIHGNLTVYTSTQYSFRDRRQIAAALGIDVSKVRVIQAVTGGGFGAKDDMNGEVHASLLALATKRPVKFVYTREESFKTSYKRHRFLVECETGITRNGKLTFMEASVYGDTGPYAALGMFVVKKAGIHLAGPYEIPNIKVDTYTVYTNNCLSGSFRGFGVPEAAFIHESQMDQLATKIGISPFEIRKLNCFQVGSLTATSQKLEHSIGIGATISKIEEVYENWLQERGEKV